MALHRAFKSPKSELCLKWLTIGIICWIVIDCFDYLNNNIIWNAAGRIHNSIISFYRNGSIIIYTYILYNIYKGSLPIILPYILLYIYVDCVLKSTPVSLLDHRRSCSFSHACLFVYIFFIGTINESIPFRQIRRRIYNIIFRKRFHADTTTTFIHIHII